MGSYIKDRTMMSLKAGVVLAVAILVISLGNTGGEHSRNTDLKPRRCTWDLACKNTNREGHLCCDYNGPPRSTDVKPRRCTWDLACKNPNREGDLCCDYNGPPRNTDVIELKEGYILKIRYKSISS